MKTPIIDIMPTKNEAPCKFDNNGECLKCDTTFEHCAYDRWKNKDYKWESKEELDQMFKEYE